MSTICCLVTFIWATTSPPELSTVRAVIVLLPTVKATFEMVQVLLEELNVAGWLLTKTLAIPTELFAVPETVIELLVVVELLAGEVIAILVISVS